MEAWHWIGLASGMLFYWLVIRPVRLRAKVRREAAKKMAEGFMEAMMEGVKKSIEETKLLRSDEAPIDADVEKYYKMYLKKKEMQGKDEWNTEIPMSFDEWKDQVKERSKTGHGYAFMIANTSDAMIGFPPNAAYQRFYDYEDMVKDETIESLLEAIANPREEVEAKG